LGEVKVRRGIKSHQYLNKRRGLGELKVRRRMLNSEVSFGRIEGEEGDSESLILE
jgi:hypothetical protein